MARIQRCTAAAPQLYHWPVRCIDQCVLVLVCCINCVLVPDLHHLSNKQRPIAAVALTEVRPATDSGHSISNHSPCWQANAGWARVTSSLPTSPSNQPLPGSPLAQNTFSRLWGRLIAAVPTPWPLTRPGGGARREMAPRQRHRAGRRRLAPSILLLALALSTIYYARHVGGRVDAATEHALRTGGTAKPDATTPARVHGRMTKSGVLAVVSMLAEGHKWNDLLFPPDWVKRRLAGEKPEPPSKYCNPMFNDK